MHSDLAFLSHITRGLLFSWTQCRLKKIGTNDTKHHKIWWKVTHGPSKKPLDFGGNLDPDPRIYNRIFIAPHERVMFSKFILHAQLLEITCLRLQVT